VYEGRAEMQKTGGADAACGQRRDSASWLAWM